MKATVPVVVKDPEVWKYKVIPPTENVVVEDEIFLDGPISPRVAVLDFDPATGTLAPGVAFEAPPNVNEEGHYDYVTPLQVGDMTREREAAVVSVFGAVHKTMHMFEEPDALGRKVTWAFKAPQLLVVPRAGSWANAYYERESHSLQFFFFPDKLGNPIHTCLSQDIVAHETAHALVDGVAPDLYGAITPQSLAIHESVADLAALLCSFRCRELAQRVLQMTHGSIDKSTAFSAMAEQFGGALYVDKPLRELNNDKTLHDVDRAEPHVLSEVLSGAFYRTLVRMHDELRQQYQTGGTPDTALIATPEQEFVDGPTSRSVAEGMRANIIAASRKALFVAAERLKRTLFRGVDYLPPADVSFADFARAVLAADEASHPESSRQRDSLCHEFVTRGIVDNVSDLEVETNFAHPALDRIDLEALVASDYAAYEFADANRDLLRIPKTVASFEVRPRLDVTKLYWHRDGKREVRECLFKVSWTEVEDNVKVGELPGKRRYLAGTTLAIEWAASPRVRAVLTSRRTKSEQADTDRLITSLVERDALRIGDQALGPTGKPLRGVIAADVATRSLRIRNAGRMLHVMRER